ncbi:MAG: VOC family protein [Alphaproteobacteria bacterium]
MTTRTVDPETAIATPRLAHVVLKTAHFEEAIRFYQLVLGARIVDKSDFAAFMTHDDEHHRLALINIGAEKEANRKIAGLDHFAFTLADLHDFFRQYLRLKAADVTPYWTINHGMTTSMYYRDPDGNGVEFQVDNFATQAEQDAFFASGKFSENPIGVNFDIEQLLALYESGTPMEELLQQGTAAV